MAWTGTMAAACASALFAAGCYRSIVAHDELREGTIETALARAEDARGIHARSTVDVDVVTTAELGGIVRRAMLLPWQDDELARYEDSLIAVGLWPRDRRLLDAMVDTLGEEAVGLYVPEDRKLYVVSDPRIPTTVRLASAIARRDLMREYALAHELVHFLQHEGYPDLFAALMRIKNSDDAVWAAQAAIEGDAVRYGFAALGGAAPPPPPADFQARLERAVAERPLGDQPRLIRDGVLFPYGYGYRLSALEATLLLDRPPASTEQALHLHKRHEPFTVFDLPGPEARPLDCTSEWANSVGELGLSMLLLDLWPEPDPRAWQGWDGDRYVALRCNGKHAFAWLTSWDSELDALEFAVAYRAVAPAIASRAALTDEPSVLVRGRDVMMFTPELAAYARDALTSARRRRVATLDEAFAATPDLREESRGYGSPDTRQATRPQTIK